MEHEELEKVNLSDGEIAKFYRHVLLRFENRIKDIENEEENKRKKNPVSLLKREITLFISICATVLPMVI